MSDHKIINKRVGDVEIFEFYGSLTDRQASVSRQAVLQKIEAAQSRFALFNLRGIRELDPVGTESLTASGQHLHKCALLSPCRLIRECNEKSTADSAFHLVEDETEAAHYLAREFASGKEEDNNPRPAERRRFERLAAVLPLHASLTLEKGKRTSFFAVVTNLSEGGLYAEFIDSESEIKGRAHLDPQDPCLLELHLCLPKQDPLFLKGKVIYKNPRSSAAGIEFLDMEDVERGQLVDWLFQLHLTE